MPRSVITSKDYATNEYVHLSSKFLLQRPPSVANTHGCAWLINRCGPCEPSNYKICVSGSGEHRIASVITTKRIHANEELLLPYGCGYTRFRRQDVQPLAPPRVPIPKTERKRGRPKKLTLSMTQAEKVAIKKARAK